MPLLVIVKRGRQYIYKIDKEEFTIGRNTNSDAFLEDDAASRDHAVITFDGQDYYIADLNSTNGTRLNSAPLGNIPTRLNHRDEIRIGSTLIRFVEDEKPTMERTLTTSPAASGHDRAQDTRRSDDQGERQAARQTVPLVSSAIFISHASQDDEYVDKLVRDLQMHTGTHGWVDHIMCEAGSDWMRLVEAALDNAKLMIVVLSPYSVASRHVQAEWHRFFDTDKTIFPIVIAGCEIPYFLRTFQITDLTLYEQEQHPAVMRQFFEAVKKALLDS